MPEGRLPEGERPGASQAPGASAAPGGDFQRGLPPGLPRLTGTLDRAQTRRRRRVALGLSGSWLLLHLAAYGVRQDLAQLPPLYVAAQIGLPFAFALLSLFVATSPGKLGLGISLGAVITLALLGPLSFWLMAAGAPVPYAAAVTGNAWLSGLVCLDITLLWASFPLLAAAFSLRRAFAMGAAWRGALIGACAGLFSGAIINLHCANTGRWHMLFGHGVPVVAAALAGAFIASRWLRA